MNPAAARPPFLLLGVALLFWGWQIGQPWLGAALALLAEAARWTRLRFDLSERDSYRVADLCTLVLAGMVVLFGSTRGASAGVLASLQWLPVVFAPIVAVQDFGRSGRIRLSAIFQSLRRRRTRDPSIEDPEIDLRGPYLALALIAAGATETRGEVYYLCVVAITGFGLAALRPRRVPVFVFALLFTAAAGLGYGAHVGLNRLQTLVENLVVDWFLGDFETSAERSTTEIGSVGRSKLHDTIVARVIADRAPHASLRLLHRAGYNGYADGTWFARNAPLTEVDAVATDNRWNFAHGAPSAEARIVLRGGPPQILLALPAGVRSAVLPPGTHLARNTLGTVRADVHQDWVTVEVGYAATIADAAPPTDDDRIVPRAEQAAVEDVVRELGLRGRAPQDIVRRVHEYLSRFSYSLYRERAPAAGTSALADFLQHTRSGHCEYFATAATLLVRAAGVPARYATGYAVIEWSALEQAYIVRARHAHAWARVWANGSWQDLDATPPSWAEEEAALDPAWSRAADLLRWLAFRWAQRDALAADGVWLALLAVLLAALGWRLLRGRRLQRTKATQAGVRIERRGLDSEFYALERAWQHRAPRPAHETPCDWTLRVAAALPPELRKDMMLALALHERLRFDPAGLDAEERQSLRGRCATLARAATGG